MSEPNKTKIDNPLNDKDKTKIDDKINDATNSIKQKVLDELQKQKPEVKTPAEPSVDISAIEAKVRDKILSDMKAKMDAEAKSLAAQRIDDNVKKMADEIEALKQQIEAGAKVSNHEGQELKGVNPFDSKDKTYDTLTPEDVAAIDRATQIAFEKERRR